MPIILMKLITNKYVLVGLLALALFGYVKYLNTSLSKAREEAKAVGVLLDNQTRNLEALKQSYAKEKEAIKALSEEKQKVVVKVEERVKLVTKLEKVYVQDANGCRLDDVSFGLLTDAYKDADNRSNSTE